MRTTALLLLVLSALVSVRAVVNDFKKKIPKNTGKACSGNDDSSYCGFGAVCLSRQCTEDYSKPESILRDATDQGPCDCSSLIAAVHLVDDRTQAATKHKESSGWWGSGKKRKLGNEDLSSISFVRDCSAKGFACNRTSFSNAIDYIKSSGVASEADVPFDKTPKHCVSGKKFHTKISHKAPKKRFQKKCFSKSNDLILELRNYGPVPHDIAVYGELLSSPKLENGILTEKSFKEEDFAAVEGYLSVLIAGYGAEGSINYVVVKFPFGVAFGNRGYMKIEHELLFARYFPECYSDNYKWKQSKLPLFGFLPSKYDIEEYIEGVRTSLRSRYDLIGSQGLITRPTLIVDEKLDLNLKDGNNGIPNLRLALKALLKEVNHGPDAFRKPFKLKPYCYFLQEVVAADVVIASGRKLFLVTKMRRRKRYKGNCDSFQLDFSDEEKNTQRGVDINALFFQVEIWFPLPTSDKKGLTYGSISNGFFSSPHEYVLLNFKDLGISYDDGGPGKPPSSSDTRLIFSILLGITLLLNTQLNYFFFEDPSFNWALYACLLIPIIGIDISNFISVDSPYFYTLGVILVLFLIARVYAKPEQFVPLRGGGRQDEMVYLVDIVSNWWPVIVDRIQAIWASIPWRAIRNFIFH